uniref:Uncharacterized protein n=1 Tax=Leersia perrieri TaxID=77586 RepID=A0A0D9XGU0_9ORYZ
MPHRRIGAAAVAAGHQRLSIVIGVGTAASLLLLGIVAIFINHKHKKWRAKKQREKYLKKNRGQLLEQLVTQRADIAE